MYFRWVLFIAIPLFPLLLKAQDCEMLQAFPKIEGYYDNQLQAAEDTAFYHVIQKIVRLEETSSDTIWFFTSQSMANTPDQAYRKRLMALHCRDKKIQLDFYRLPDSLNDLLKNKQDSKVLRDTAMQHYLIDGCSMTLSLRDDKSFEGSTEKTRCPSSHRGASWVQSYMRVRSDGFEIWDSGYDQSGKKVWGAPSPYKFIRLDETY